LISANFIIKTNKRQTLKQPLYSISHAMDTIDTGTMCEY